MSAVWDQAERMAEVAKFTAAADAYSELAQHNLAESMKIRRWRENRVNRLKEKGERAYQDRPTTVHDPESIKWALSQDDPKLAEYGAGLVITERRATMYASMATDLRLAALTELLALRAD
jgi:hypothetical protein